jgi:hypothetical protein
VHPSPAVRRARALLSALVIACGLVLTTSAAAGESLPEVAAVTVLTDTPGEIVVRCEPPLSVDGAVAAESLSRVALIQVPDRGRITARSEPEGRATVSAPGILRDLRVVQVAFDIPSDDPRPVTVTLTIEPGAGQNERTAGSRPSSPAFESLYRHAVVNYTPTASARPHGGRGARAYGARYLIIADPSLSSQVQPLAQWKHLKGVQTMLVTLNDTGWTAASIKAYIQNAYDTWAVPPEYVLLVGDTEVVPSYYSETWTDDYYGTLEGSDYFVDVMIGRMSADTQAQCATQVAKILSYERTPIEGDPQWPASALLTVSDDDDAGDWIYYRNTWFIYDLMEPAGMAPIDTLFKRNSVTQSQIYQSWNAGRGFVNYRGVAGTEWPWPFNVNPSSLTNTNKLSVVISATCGTGVFYDDGYFCENIIRAGSASNPIGAVAFLGTNTSIESGQALSRRRGAADQGFFAQAFGPDGGTMGAATLGAKMAIYDFDQIRLEYEAWNLLGDPDMQLWTGPVAALQVVHSSYYHASQESLVVTVLASGQPLEGALVACVKGSDIYEWGISDAAGRAVFMLTPSSAGSMAVTVTARNRFPYEGTVSVLDSGAFVVCAEVAVDDSEGGNGDGLLSPGETADLRIRLSNVGDSNAVNVTGTLRTPDPLASIADSVASYGTIPPGGSAWCVTPYGIAADAGCGVGHQVQLDMDVAFGTMTLGISPPPVAIATADMDLVSAIVDDAAPGGDGGGTPSTGETIGLVVSMENVGPLDAAGVSVELECLSPYVTVTAGSAYLGLVEAGAGASNSATPFVLAVSPSAPNGHIIQLRLNLTGTGHSYSYEEVVAFTLEVAGPTSSVFSGPDEYGYFAYDSGDTTYAPAPEFEWYDIATPGPGSLITAITNSDAAITTINLPFAFWYYGTQYLQASVCSNGFISMGSEDYKAGTNSAVGSADGPDRMIAPFWDDLNPMASGDIYRWHDIANHRFIIQFDEVPIWGTMDIQTFQVVFLHPDYYPTPTGDGQILFLYETVSNPGGCTVGIENPAQTDGIGYLFDGAYDPHAAPLADGLAVLFTTVGAPEPTYPWLTLDAVVVDDAAGNDNGLAEPGETVALTLTLGNGGAIPATGVSGTMTAEAGLAQVIDGAGIFTDIAVGGSGSNAGDPFVVELSQAIDDTVVTLWALVEANGGGYSVPVRCDLHINLSATSVADVPLAFGVLHASPNPFTGTTTLALALPEPSPVTLSVYDIAGRLVRRLDHGLLGAGTHLLRWDGRDEGGRQAASGVYFLRIGAGDRTEDRKAVLLR